MKNVKEVYQMLLLEGYTKKDAAKEAQNRTGMSVVTGRPIDRQLKFNKPKKTPFGQYAEVKHGR